MPTVKVQNFKIYYLLSLFNTITYCTSIWIKQYIYIVFTSENVYNCTIQKSPITKIPRAVFSKI